MANPLPLSTPDGVTYAYICGECRQLATPSSMGMGPMAAWQIQQCSEWSLRNAEQCCVCRACSGPAPSRNFDTNYMCQACYDKTAPDREARQVEWEAEAKIKAAAREASLLLAKDRASALTLEQVMSDISEKYYCAGWLVNLEYSLWDIMHTDPQSPTFGMFGMGAVSPDEVAQLKSLCEAAGGWWTYDIFRPLEEWVILFEQGPQDKEEY